MDFWSSVFFLHVGDPALEKSEKEDRLNA